ncbi:MAG: tRNA (adenosine(37)-N6)-threonylcarbamoyltransferase complex ATPase subunit type 1 TsaE [Bacteroidetes bacterium GWF2_49_14]|nr:MAG: tRNA (adenosine(37)-N6)-threonylcarbamoyltransferase complex ATPase subunit type 1 TsaE [Bacteroidetes bacterium GWF2_49_14]HBB91982.1 tRNA (adenosine(37)-N6)-threonylcarbamoyltransferase complex ATPase subunit type 1 TsaE [Bacteroidales bacterium]
MKELVYHAGTLSALPGIAKSIIADAGDQRLLAFFGDMGVGKTTLIQSICHSLGVVTEVTSPTFALVNEYAATGGPVFHFDFYRINRIEEALDFGIEEYFDSGAWCLMEWPERVESLLPEPLVRLHLTEDPDGSRTIRVKIPS